MVYGCRKLANDGSRWERSKSRVMLLSSESWWYGDLVIIVEVGTGWMRESEAGSGRGGEEESTSGAVNLSEFGSVSQSSLAALGTASLPPSSSIQCDTPGARLHHPG
jgi:hypothetical protein